MKISLPSYVVYTALLLLAGKITGLLRDLFLGFNHGISEITDAFFLASSVSSLVYIGIYASVPLVVVPIYARLVRYHTDAEQDRLNSTLAVYLLSAFILSTICYFFSLELLEILSPTVGDSLLSLTAQYLQVMCVSFVLSTLVAYCNAVHTVEGVTTTSYSVAIANNISFCVAITVFNTREEFLFVIWAGVVTWFLLSVLNVWLLSSLNIVYLRIRYFVNSIKFITLAAPAVLAIYLDQMFYYTSIYFATGIGSESVSIISYANKLNLLVISTALLVVTTQLFPKIANLIELGEGVAIRSFVVAGIKAIVLLVLPIILVLSTFSNQVVELLYGRGEFDSQDVISVSAILSILVFLLLFSILRDFCNRYFFANGERILPLVIGGISLMLNVLLCVFFAPNFGLEGIAISSVVAVGVAGCVSLILVFRALDIDWRPTVFKLGLICLFCGLSLVFYLHGMSILSPNYWILWSILGTLSFYGLTHFLGCSIFHEIAALSIFVKAGGDTITRRGV
jgi:putative peptidoglycan lipid II flippase